jgi:hypothetical protein
MIIQTPRRILVLPNPQLGNKITGGDEVSNFHMMDGTRRTYIKRRSTRVHSWSFQVTRMKSLEVLDFFLTENSETWTVTNYDGSTITGKCLTNPITVTPFVYGPHGTANEEMASFEIEFEGE